MSAGPQLFSPSEATRESPAHARANALGASLAWYPFDQPESASQRWAIPEGTIFAWSAPHVRIELALLEIAPELPESMTVTGCLVGVWRIRSDARADTPKLTCRLSHPSAAIDGGPESGEFLDATTWESAQGRWSIGTQDADALHARSTAGDRLPKEWAEQLRHFTEPAAAMNTRYPITYFDAGIEIVLPDLPAHTTAQVHHAAAWQRKPAADDASTWYAVDLGPQRQYIGDL